MLGASVDLVKLLDQLVALFLKGFEGLFPHGEVDEQGQIPPCQDS